MTNENALYHLSAIAVTALELLEDGTYDIDECKETIESLLSSAYSYGKIAGIDQTTERWKATCSEIVDNAKHAIYEY